MVSDCGAAAAVVLFATVFPPLLRMRNGLDGLLQMYHQFILRHRDNVYITCVVRNAGVTATEEGVLR